MTRTDDTITTMRLGDLPPVAREPWLKLLKIIAEDTDPNDPNALTDVDLIATFRIFRRAEWISDCGAEVRTTDGETWYVDDTDPYQAKE